MLVSSLRVDSVILGHPGEALPQLVRIRAVGSGGEPILAARVQWTTSGAGAQINESSTQTDANGYAFARWVLGTRAADSQALAVRVTTGSHSAGAKYRASAVPYVVSHVTLLPTGVQTLRLGDTLGCSLQAEDPFGNKFTPPHPQFVSTDTTLLKVDTLGRVHLRRRGTVQVVGIAATAVDTMRVNVIQIVQSIVTTLDTFRFHAIGQVASDSITLMDDRGLVVKDSVPQVRLLDTTIVRLVQLYPLTLRSNSNGTTLVQVQAGSLLKTLGVAVVQQATFIQVPEASILFDALGDTVRLTPALVDSLGVVLTKSQVAFSSTDSTTVSVSVDGLVRSRRNGAVLLVIRANTGATDTVPVTVSQKIARVTIAQDSILFDALGATAVVRATAIDRLGSPVTGAALAYRTGDTTVATVASDGTISARANGSTSLVASAGADSVVGGVRVLQRPVRINAQLAQGGITSVFLDSLIPLSCNVLDRNGNVIDTVPVVAPSSTGHWAGGNCNGVRALRSGFDTLRVQAGGLEAQVPVVLAIRPIVSSPTGDFVQFDSLPAGRAPFSPTAHRNSRGELEVYFAAYPLNASTWDDTRSDLYRLVSSDGITFRYDGVALRHDDSLCAPQGSGIENVSIVPRADGPGWRMFFSAGSFACYGWQVFSAVSTDERTWVKEPGVRVTNGGTLGAPSFGPWPAGEGMVTEQLPSGEWRMILGGYEQILPHEDKFQIVEWRSPDQVNWSYVGPMLTTRDMPAGGQGTIYSPTIRQIAPGLWRMIFSGDDRFQPGWRGRIWSAVSADEQSWQLEGELMGGQQTRYWYASLVDEHLVFLRQDDGDQRRLAIASVTMP